MERLVAGAKSRWELDALDYKPAEKTLFLRVCGPESAADALIREIADTWSGDTKPFDDGEASEFWENVREFKWAYNGLPESLGWSPETEPASARHAWSRYVEHLHQLSKR